SDQLSWNQDGTSISVPPPPVRDSTRSLTGPAAGVPPPAHDLGQGTPGFAADAQARTAVLPLEPAASQPFERIQTVVLQAEPAVRASERATRRRSPEETLAGVGKLAAALPPHDRFIQVATEPAISPPMRPSYATLVVAPGAIAPALRDDEAPGDATSFDELM